MIDILLIQSYSHPSFGTHKSYISLAAKCFVYISPILLILFTFSSDIEKTAVVSLPSMHNARAVSLTEPRGAALLVSWYQQGNVNKSRAVCFRSPPLHLKISQLSSQQAYFHSQFHHPFCFFAARITTQLFLNFQTKRVTFRLQMDHYQTDTSSAASKRGRRLKLNNIFATKKEGHNQSKLIFFFRNVYI